MAQQTQTPGGQKKSSGAAPASSGANTGFLGGLRSFFAPSPATTQVKTGANAGSATSGTSTRPALNFRKVLLGFLLLLVGVYAIQFLLLFVDVQFFHRALTNTPVLPHSVPLIGGLTLYSLLAIVLMIGLWLLLYRLDLLPRANKPQPQSSASGAAANRTRAAKKPAPALSGKDAAAARPALSGPNDDEYEQVRMAQRARRRRDARR
jgi:hypothetical protein